MHAVYVQHLYLPLTLRTAVGSLRLATDRPLLLSGCFPVCPCVTLIPSLRMLPGLSPCHSKSFSPDASRSVPVSHCISHCLTTFFCVPICPIAPISISLAVTLFLPLIKWKRWRVSDILHVPGSQTNSRLLQILEPSSQVCVTFLLKQIFDHARTLSVSFPLLTNN